MSSFDFILKHIPGNKIGKANGLSRRSNWERGVKGDNEEKVLVKLEWLEVKRIQVAEVIVERVNVLEKIKRSEARDNEVIKAVEKMKRAGVKMLRDKE